MIVDKYVLKINRLSSLKLTTALLVPTIALALFIGGPKGLILGTIGMLLSALVFQTFTKKPRRRYKIQNQDFPKAYEDLLKENVAYYNALSQRDQDRFKKMVLTFIDEYPVIGVEVEVTDLHRILVAASAIIPIMGLPHWEYEYLSEILLYPANFDTDYSGKGNVLGLVHGSLQNGVVILSEPALVAGFANPNDTRNVGIHEFAHMVDKRDGSIDGLAAALPSELVKPWRELMVTKMEEAGKKGRATINPYAHTNDQEFLAVTTEYFFENPERLEAEHPEVYKILEKIYNQDPAELLKEEFHLLKKKKLGRNDPCPCQSGKKWKHCCMKKR